MSEPTGWPAARADPLLAPWSRAVTDAVGAQELWDAHTHIGSNDPDGMRISAPDLIAGLERAGARAAVFPMHEPDGYPPANDMVLEAAAAAEGRLVPFCRLDPRDRPVQEAKRCLDAGARGIKLHPRAERFTLNDPGVVDIVALAHERRLPVLFHAGRGIPALGRHALELTGRFPDARVILAHAAICDLAWIWREAPSHPNLFFDTAWWSPADLLALVTYVPPGQVLWASDAPYGSPLIAQNLGLRCALHAGLSREAVQSIAGGQFRRLLDGEDPLDLGPAPREATPPPDLLLERVHTFLTFALARMIGGADTGEEGMALARLACHVDPGSRHAEVFESVLELLDRGEGFAGELARDGVLAGRPPHLPFVIVAASIARTPDAPLPVTA